MLGACHVCDSCVKKNPVFVTSDNLVVEALQGMVQGLYQFREHIGIFKAFFFPFNF